MPLSVEIARAFIRLEADFNDLKRQLRELGDEATITPRVDSSEIEREAPRLQGLWKEIFRAEIIKDAVSNVVSFVKGQFDELKRLSHIEAQLRFQVGDVAEARAAIEELKGISLATGGAVTTLAEAYLKLRREGEGAASAMEQVNKGAQLAMALGEDLGRTIDNLNDVYDLYADELGSVAEWHDKLAVLSTKAGGGLNELLEVIKVAGPVARGLGVDFKTLSGVLAQLQADGYEGARAANAMAEAFRRAEEIKNILPSPDEIARLRELSAELAMLHTRLAETADKEEAKKIKEHIKELSAQLRDMESSVAIPKQLQDVMEKLGATGAEVFERFRSGKTTFFEFVVELKNAGADANDLYKIFGDLGAKMLEVVIPAIQNSDSVMNQLARQLENASGKAKELTETVDKSMAGAFNRVVGALQTMAMSVLDVFAKPVEGAVVAISDALRQLAEGETPDLFVQLFGGKAEAERFLNAVQGVAKAIGETLVTAFKVLADAVGAVLPVLGDIFKLLSDLRVFDAFRLALGGVGEALKVIFGVLEAVVSILRGDWARAWEGAGKVLEGVIGIFKSVADVVGAVAGGLRDVIAGIIGVKSASQAAATPEEQLALSRAMGARAAREVVGEEIAKRIDALLGEIKSLKDQSAQVTALLKFIESEAKRTGKSATEIGSAIYSALLAANQKALADALAAAFKEWRAVQGKQHGGLVFGVGSGDKVPALLEPGEFVLRKRAVQALGLQTVMALNALQGGGPVDDASLASLASAILRQRGAAAREAEITSLIGRRLEALFEDLFGPIEPLVRGPMRLFEEALNSLAEKIEKIVPASRTFISNLLDLIARSKTYKELQEDLNAIIQAVADVFGLILAPLAAFVRGIREALGIYEEVTDVFTQMTVNVPSGFKLERARFASILEGLPTGGGGGEGGSIFAHIVNAFRELGEVVGEVIRAIIDFLGPWTSVILAVTGAVVAFNMIAPVVSGVISFFASIPAILSSIFAGLSATLSVIFSPIGAAVAAMIAALALFPGQLASVFSGLFTILSPIFTLFGNILSAVANVLSAIFQPVINAIAAVLKALKPVIEAIANVIWAILKPAFDFLGAIAQALGNVLAGVIDVIRIPFNILIAAINFVIGIVNTIINVLKSIPIIGWLFGWLPTLPMLPFLQTGGVVKETGAAIVHKGEVVIPANKAGMGITIGQLVIEGEDAETIRRIIMRANMRRRGIAYSGAFLE